MGGGGYCCDGNRHEIFTSKVKEEENNHAPWPKEKGKCNIQTRSKETEILVTLLRTDALALPPGPNRSSEAEGTDASSMRLLQRALTRKSPRNDGAADSRNRTITFPINMSPFCEQQGLTQPTVWGFS